MLTYKIRIGEGTLEFQADSLDKICRMSAVLGMIPSACSNCESQKVFLSHKNPGGNDYYVVKCKDCGAELLIRQKKAGGYYIKDDDKMSVYVKPDQPAEQKPQEEIVGDIF